MKIVAYNMQWGMGNDRKLDLARIARAVDGADVIAFQEVEAHWRRSGDVDQAKALAALLPTYHWVYGPGFDMEASRVRPDGTVEHRRRQFGNMTLAKAPILSCRTLPLPKIAVHVHGSMQTAVVETVIAIGGKALRVYNVHLDDVLGRERLVQIAALRAFMTAAPLEGGIMSGTILPVDPYQDEDWHNGEPIPPMPVPAIALGDFNSLPGSPEYDAVVGPPDPRQGRVVTPDFLFDTMTVAGHPLDCGATWYPCEGRSSEPPRRLDYIFATADLISAVRHAWIDQDARGSDHQPVWVELDW